MNRITHQDVIDVSRPYAIPTHKIEINEYRDAERVCDVHQIYFRTPYRPRKKFAFELAIGDRYNAVTPNTQKINDLENELHKSFEVMEESYLSNTGDVVFYKGQPISIKPLSVDHDGRMFMHGHVSTDEMMVHAECLCCGYSSKVDVMKESTLMKYIDLFRIYLPKDISEECECASMQRPTEPDRSSKLSKNSINVGEGEKLPRTIL